MLKILRLPEVVEATGKSPTSIWRAEREGRFPRRRRIGPNAVGWRSDEIQAWIEARPLADEPAAEPEVASVEMEAEP